MSKSMLAALLLMCCGFGCTTSRPLATKPYGFTTTVKVVDECLFQVEIRNSTQGPLLVEDYDIPWKYRYAMIIKAFELDHSGSPLEELFPIADKPVARLSRTVKSGEYLSGTIDLAARFPELREARKRHDVLCVWLWRVKTNDKPIEQHSGVLIIPKT